MSKDNPDWGWWKSEAKRRGKRAGTRARKGAKEAARRTRYSADYTSWQARNQYAAHRVRSLEACAKALGFDPARTPQPGGETIQTAKRHWQQTAAQKPNLAKYNPARVEALKQKLYAFSSSLSNWNLKYHEFPDIDAWLDKNWDAPYGRDVAKAYLEAAASRRSENYWGSHRAWRHSRQDIERETDLNLRLRGTFLDLSGDESTRIAFAKRAAARQIKQTFGEPKPPPWLKKNPKKMYGSLPAVGHAEHEIREEGFSDIVSTGRERSPNGPVLTFEAKRLAFQGQYAGLWSIFKLTVGRVAGSDRLHVKVYRM